MKKYLILVDASDATQSNKYYNMELTDDEVLVEYGRIGSTKATANYPSKRFNSLLNSKLRKGYKDITHLKEVPVKQATTSHNKDFDYFFDTFSAYTSKLVNRSYVTDRCTPQQKNEVQKLINSLSTVASIERGNKILLEIYNTLPRKMHNVRDYLMLDMQELNQYIATEQDMLDSMDSSNIIQESDVLSSLQINTFSEVFDTKIANLINSTNNSRYKIHRMFCLDHPRKNIFENWVKKQENKQTDYFIHGTRNPNIFSILKEGLRIRPSNTATYTGSVYGDGIYHSKHTAKSLNYTGNDNDKIFFIQKVHVGNPYEYNGWYRDGKDISRNEMKYDSLRKKGYDSLYVKPGDGLLNSEYIVYREEQTVTNFIVWLK